MLGKNKSHFLFICQYRSLFKTTDIFFNREFGELKKGIISFVFKIRLLFQELNIVLIDRTRCQM